MAMSALRLSEKMTKFDFYPDVALLESEKPHQYVCMYVCMYVFMYAYDALLIILLFIAQLFTLCILILFNF